MNLELVFPLESGSISKMDIMIQEANHSNCSDSTLENSRSTKPSEKKRKECNTQHSRLRPKRFRRDARICKPILEQLTPDVVRKPEIGLRTFGPFFPGQFEDGTVRIVNMNEDELIDALSSILGDICKQNESVVLRTGPRVPGKPPYISEKYPDGSSSVFFSLSKPAIVLRNYLARFVRYLNVSRSVFIVGLIYLDRVRADDYLLALTQLNIHRLITTALCTAAKFLEDESHRNSSLSRIGGIPSTQEMNVLESQFLRRLQWDCAVPIATYQQYEECVIRKSNSALHELETRNETL